MVAHVIAQMLPLQIERRARTAGVASRLSRESAEIISQRQSLELIGHIRTQIGNQDGDAVKDWIFAQARWPGTMKNALQNAIVLPAYHPPQVQRRPFAVEPAHRADGLQRFKMPQPHC